MNNKIKILGEDKLNKKEKDILEEVSKRNFDKLNKKYGLEKIELKIKEYKEEGKEKEFSINLKGYIENRKYEVDSAPSYSRWKLSRKNWVLSTVAKEAFKKLDGVLKNAFKKKG